MNTIRPLLYFILILCLCYFTYSLATDYQNIATRNQVSFVIWVIDTIDLFIHEAGHPLFDIFGRFMNFLGGSLFQIIIPAATVIVFARSSLKSLPFTLYWTGQSTVNVSMYISDAPFQRLQLISRHAMHDWRWLLGYTGTLEYAEDIGNIVNVVGLLTCLVGIAFGIYFSIRDVKNLFSSNQNQHNPESPYSFKKDTEK